ncbi:hypothetical protein ACIBK9_19040 [Nonomuraea sp. NPDC050227]|uniref:hypothetical protein n=1 Tax=Nonomuraea sp. NPDC050227 TaxID=3364360 RepID=UPI00379A68C1
MRGAGVSRKKWDWAHFFDLLGAPLSPDGDAGTATVMIRPDHDTSRPHCIGCDDGHPETDWPGPRSASDVEVQPLVPLQYTFPAGQAYTVGLTTTGEYYRATTFDTTQHRVVRGTHRVMFVRSEDVVVTDA